MSERISQLPEYTTPQDSDWLVIVDRSTSETKKIQYKYVNTEGGTSGTSGVTSFNSRVGAVTPQSGDYTTATVADSTDKRYVTDAQRTVLGNTSGTNSGDQKNGNMTVYTIAASNSSATDKANAIFTCSGTADQTQINTYITSLLADKGGIILLAAGTYNLSSTILIAGSGTSNGPTISIIGAGNRNTILVPASGTHAITISGATQVNIWDMQCNVLGSTDFIHTTAPGSAPYWSFWLSSFKNLYVQGDFSTHSGWVMNMEAPFRSTFENIEGQGIGNGIYVKSTTPSFNPGNCTFQRCFFDLNAAANGVGYKIHTTDGNGLMNILTFIHCEAIDSKSSSTTSIGWYFIGSTTDYHTTKDVTIINSNIEQFNTCVKSSHSVENHVHLSYADTKTGGTIFDISSDSNGEFMCDSGYIAPSATTKFLNDANSSTTHPTIAGGYSAYVDTGATLSITKTSATVLTKLNATGPGTIPTEFTTYDLPANKFLGNLSISNFNSGTSASSSTFWRGDGTWAAVAGSGTVTSVTSADANATVATTTTTPVITIVSAPKLQTARTIGGVSFDGTSNITVSTATAGFTVSGGSLALGANSFTLTGSIGATGARSTKGWFTDLEITNMPTVSGTSLSSTFQPLDSDLTTIAGLTATTDNFIVSVSSAWASRTPAQVRTTLALVIGTNVQAWDADLDTWATKTAPSGVVVGTTDTQTLSAKFITPQVQSVTDAGGTFTPVSITNDICVATALSQATTIAAPTGSPVQGERLIIRLKDNGTARALTWNAIYRASSDLALPTTTVISKTLYCGFIYNSTDTKWDLVAYINNF